MRSLRAAWPHLLCRLHVDCRSAVLWNSEEFPKLVKTCRSCRQKARLQKPEKGVHLVLVSLRIGVWSVPVFAQAGTIGTRGKWSRRTPLPRCSILGLVLTPKPLQNQPVIYPSWHKFSTLSFGRRPCRTPRPYALTQHYHVWFTRPFSNGDLLRPARPERHEFACTLQSGLLPLEASSELDLLPQTEQLLLW